MKSTVNHPGLNAGVSRAFLMIDAAKATLKMSFFLLVAFFATGARGDATGALTHKTSKASAYVVTRISETSPRLIDAFIKRLEVTNSPQLAAIRLKGEYHVLLDIAHSLRGQCAIAAREETGWAYVANKLDKSLTAYARDGDPSWRSMVGIIQPSMYRLQQACPQAFSGLR